MNQEIIYAKLLDKGFQEKPASVLSEDLSKISIELETALRSWIESDEENDYVANGVSLKGLMKQYQLQYPAALLSIDWVIKDPNTATAAIKRGIR